MKKLILLIWILLLHTACETGNKYDTKTAAEDSESGIVDMLHEEMVEDDPTHSNSYYIDQGEDNYAEELSLAESQPEEVEVSDISEEEYEEERQQSEVQHFTGGNLSDGLDISKVRKANHKSYVRLVLDSKGSNKVGSYSVDYNPNRGLITVVLDGYRAFSATLPTFEKSSIVEKIYFDKYLDDSGYKLQIKLREETKIKVIALDPHSRLDFHIKKH
jgi:hypothetical protein